MFPQLAAAGSLYGYVDHGYWRDIGTPDSYLQAHFDILERQARHVGRRRCSASCTCTSLADGRGRARRADRAAGATSPTARRSAPARAWARWPCSAPGAWSATAPTVVESVVQDGVVIGAHAQVEGSILVAGRRVVGARHQLNGAVARRGLP